MRVIKKCAICGEGRELGRPLSKGYRKLNYWEFICSENYAKKTCSTSCSIALRTRREGLKVR